MGDVGTDSDEPIIISPPPVSTRKKTTVRTCSGICLVFPSKQNPHTSYPFGLHAQRAIPWDYHSINDNFYLQSKACRKFAADLKECCLACEGLRSDHLYKGIVDRIHEGVHENTPLAYQPIGGLVKIVRQKARQISQLELTQSNDARKLLGKASALDDHKQWILAVASGRVDRVAALVKTGLSRKTGIRGLIAEYERAALKLYKPKGYSEQDIMRSIVMLRLGGARVAEFAHRAMSLPSVTVARRNTVLCPLIVSPSWPTATEIEENMRSCLEPLAQQSSETHPKIQHQVLMLDEIAIEKRPRWDDWSNMILGICREHSGTVPLEFNSEKELDLLCDGLDANTVHLASEATVGAFGTLSEDPCEVSICPAVISGLCKHETGPQHAQFIRTILTAGKKFNTKYRTVSIASDGESKHGDALVEVESSIHSELSPLKLMNFLVGEDSITADKDFKHIFKCQHNLWMRNKGVLVNGFCITPALLKAQLQENGVAASHIRAIINPNDKQDVVLGYALLKEIWILPAVPAGSD